MLSVDDKSEIQTLDRTQPGLPLKNGRCGRMTHDSVRNGTTTVFAALNVLEGGVIGRCMRWYRRQEFIRFLKAHPLRTLSCGPMPKPELNALATGAMTAHKPSARGFRRGT